MPYESMSNVFQPFITKEGGINKGCKYIAKKLKGKWTWKYLYHVYRGTVTPGARLKRKLMKLKPPTPRRKRYRLTIETDNETEYKRWKKYTMRQRQEAFDNIGKD